MNLYIYIYINLYINMYLYYLYIYKSKCPVNQKLCSTSLIMKDIQMKIR